MPRARTMAARSRQISAVPPKSGADLHHAFTARHDLEGTQLLLEVARARRVVEVGAQKRRQQDAALAQSAKDENALHLGKAGPLSRRNVRARGARLVDELARVAAPEVEVEDDAPAARRAADHVVQVRSGYEIEFRSEETAEPRQVLVAVLAHDPAWLHACAPPPPSGKHAPTTLRSGALSGRRTRWPCHSRVRSRTIANPRPLSRDSMRSRVSSPSAESPTRSTRIRRPAASRSSPRRTRTRPSGAEAACALRKRFAKIVVSASRSTGNSTSTPCTRIEGETQPEPPRLTSPSTPRIHPSTSWAETRVRGPRRSSAARREPCSSRILASIAAIRCRRREALRKSVP